MLKRPGNEFTIADYSGQYVSMGTPSVTAPLMLAVASFDKGDERFRVVSGDDFFRMYGDTISFEKHGQPAIQAANVILNGGKLLVKRAVADDATLANVIITATVTKTQVPKVDEDGKPLYIDGISGTETTDEISVIGKNNRAMINNATIKYNVVSIEGAKNLRELQVAANGLIVERDPLKEMIEGGKDTGTATPSTPVNTDVVSDKNQVPSALPGNIPLPIGALGPEGEESEYTYPLYIICDNGRGESTKRFNIVPDHAVSKNLKFVLYKFNYFGKANLDSEYVRFSADPTNIYNGANMSLTESAKSLVQVNAAAYDKGLEKFINKVSEFSGIERDELVKIDLLFGMDARGDSIPQISVDEDGYDLTSNYGIQLMNGSNGSFGDHPFGTEAYTQKLVDIFSGADNPEIFDVEQHKIEVCVDANYPLEVKKAITDLVNFRKDFFYFRDLGLDCETHESIALMTRALPDTMYAANYCQSYDVLDPFSRKEISVTIGYSIARLLINHLNTSRDCPFNGQLYNITIPEAIEGSVSYIPRILPTIDQKQKLYDLHMNYAAIVNNVLTIETQIDSQTEETQCSWINNILIIQQIIREIREQCPRTRYSFIDTTSGLAKYANDVQNILSRHTTEVDSIYFEYSSDAAELASHIFNATINVKFKEYVDFEKFTICVFD